MGVSILGPEMSRRKETFDILAEMLTVLEKSKKTYIFLVVAFMLTKMFNFEANYSTNQYSRKLETLISRKFHFQWGAMFWGDKWK